MRYMMTVRFGIVPEHENDDRITDLTFQINGTSPSNATVKGFAMLEALNPDVARAVRDFRITQW